MPFNLEKGGSVELHREAPTLKVAGVGLGWDAKSEKQGFLGSLFGATPAEYDLDAVAFVLGANGKLVSDSFFIYFNNKTAPNNALVHGGDNITGEGDGDDETITIDFDKLPPEAKKIVVWVTIYKAGERKQSFAEVENSFVRLYDAKSNQELLKFALNEQFSKSEIAMEFCHINRTPEGWTFQAVGKGHHLEIGGVLALYQ